MSGLYCMRCGGDRVAPTGPGFDERYPWGWCRDCDRRVIATTSQAEAVGIVAGLRRRKAATR